MCDDALYTNCTNIFAFIQSLYNAWFCQVLKRIKFKRNASRRSYVHPKEVNLKEVEEIKKNDRKLLNYGT